MFVADAVLVDVSHTEPDGAAVELATPQVYAAVERRLYHGKHHMILLGRRQTSIGLLSVSHELAGRILLQPS